jgi:PadR family transcriptional regulator PadR
MCGFMKTRRTQARLAIASELLTRRDQAHWGYELSRRAGVGPGSMYPFLAELLAAGYLTDGWEDRPPAGRPPRRHYEVTDKGETFLREFVASAPDVARKKRGRVGVRLPGAVSS